MYSPFSMFKILTDATYMLWNCMKAQTMQRFSFSSKLTLCVVKVI